MVPTDDAQEPEPTAPQITAGNEPPTACANSTARLTSMPPWLMYWWTPLAIAEGLLRWTLILAIFWGGQPHWPSSEAMKLCVTIVGAGLAFSAWQQRSHDNAVKEDEQAQAQRELERERLDNDKRRQDEQERYERERKAHERNRLEQIERDEYWKRREHIYQLLGSENPGLRLGAVALLAELADSAAHSTLLNDSEKQQLQRHIIDTLCLQVRHEGQAPDIAKNSNEHSKIQQLIIDTILKRADVNKMNNSLANWSCQKIDLSDSNIITTVYISDFKTLSLINFNGSHFFKPVTIRQSTIGRILWQTATFDSFLTVGNFEHPTKFGTDGFPHRINSAEFYNTTIITSHGYTIDRSPSTNTPLSGLMLKSCTFLEEYCNCATSCYCKLKGGACLCNFQLKCNCKNKCFTHGEIDIQDQTNLPNSTKRNPKLQIIGCTVGRIYVEFDNSSSNIFLSHNSIEDEIYISLSSELVKNQVSPPSEGKPDSLKSQITLHKNTSLEGDAPALITIQPTNETIATEYVKITQEL
jgi:hypothetical protein